jgi:hypothetical protein
MTIFMTAKALLARNTRNTLVVLVLLFTATMTAPPANAGPHIVIQQMQMPVWIERFGDRFPLRPEMELRDDDIIETGAQGRVWMALADGSVLRLGEHSRLSIEKLDLHKTGDRALDGIIRIPHGTFRSMAPEKLNGRSRSLVIRLADMAIVDGRADVWGRTLEQETIVCLVKNQIRVRPAAGESFEMDQPFTCTRASSGGAVTPTAPIPPETLRRWTALTGMVPGAGTVHANGGWRVHLASFLDVEAARTILGKLEQAGYAANLSTKKLKGKTYSRISISDLDSHADAVRLGERLTGQFWIRSPWAESTARD